MKPKKENKKGGAIVSLIVGIIFVLLAIMCFIGDMDYLLGGKAKDLNEIAANVRPQKDDHVRTDSYLVLGNFAETKHYINGIIPQARNSITRSYLVMITWMILRMRRLSYLP